MTKTIEEQSVLNEVKGNDHVETILQAYEIGRLAGINEEQAKRNESHMKLIDVAELFSIADTLRGATIEKEPFYMHENLPNGERKPFVASREHFLEFYADITVENLYNLLEKYIDDEGELSL